jgi:hypothetical protein
MLFIKRILLQTLFIMKKIYTLIALVLLFLLSNKSMAQCAQPTNLIVTYSNNVSTFTWDAVPGAIDYAFELKFPYDPWGTGLGDVIIPLGGTTESYSITGLAESFAFSWRVQTNCGTSVSAYSESTYTTPCPIPTNASVTNITGTSATINWVSSSSQPNASFGVSYRLANTTNAWTSVGNTNTTSKIITGLLSNTAYEFCVNQRCSYSNSNPLIGQFTTLFVACNTPINFSTSAISSNQATVSWGLVSNALNYTVDYKPTTSSTWLTTTTTSNTNSKVLTGLISATLYDVRVKTNCSSGGSNYLTSQFTTYSSPCAAWGVNSSEYIDLFSLGTINRTSAREVGGYYNTGISTNLLIGSTINTGQFSAGYNPGIIFGEYYAVYIDFNRNGTFTDVGETVVNPAYVASGSSIFNFNIAIPATATSGVTKMRVVIRRSGTTIVPCSTGFKGEVEDYDVNLVTSLRASLDTPKDEVETNTEAFIEKILVYPNPTSGNFNVQIADGFEPSYYEIIDMNGIIVKKQYLNASKLFVVDITSQKNGLYLLNIISAKDNGRITKRICLEK